MRLMVLLAFAARGARALRSGGGARARLPSLRSPRPSLGPRRTSTLDQPAVRPFLGAAALSFCLEESPPKNGLPHTYGRITFPHLAVDARTCAALKHVCTVACHEAWPAHDLARWADVIDPQSRSARTHHSAKLCKPGEDCRISRVVGFFLPPTIAALAPLLGPPPWARACDALLRACAAADVSALVRNCHA